MDAGDHHRQGRGAAAAAAAAAAALSPNQFHLHRNALSSSGGQVYLQWYMALELDVPGLHALEFELILPRARHLLCNSD